uniref:Uncharacterized protein n=1 Tax=Magallana gigas TaxID=29159 RepID=K1QZP1_MAGGI
MAEASATPHWRSWRNLQVIWLIDEVYNTFWEATKFNTKRLLDLGDELDDEKYERLHKKEIHHILDTLNRPDKCCELVRLKEKGIVLHQESFNNIFETLALGFEESSDIMAEIMEELIKNKGNTKYKDHDSKNWIQTVLRKKTLIPWDPLVFYVCANKYECAVSIQANDTDEYRFYPETVSNKPIIKFARVESSQYVCLMRDQEEFVNFLSNDDFVYFSSNFSNKFS